MKQPEKQNFLIQGLKQLDKTTLGVTWHDGGQSRLPVRLLRLKCPCAQCVDEMTGKVILQEEQVPADIQPIKIEPVGHYALRFHWNDGHDTGIYTFKLLRSLARAET